MRAQTEKRRSCGFTFFFEIVVLLLVVEIILRFYFKKKRLSCGFAYGDESISGIGLVLEKAGPRPAVSKFFHFYIF